MTTMTETTAPRLPPRWLLAIELALFVAAHFLITPALRAVGAPMAMLELPLVKTAWIYFALALAMIVWFRARGYALANLGLKPFAAPFRTIGLGLLGVVAAIATSTLTDPLLTQWFGEANTSRFDVVTGNLPLAAFLLACVWVFAAFGEEFFYRGFIFTHIANVLGGGRVAWACALIVQAVLFGFAHAYQGPNGMIGTGLYGLILGGVFLLSKRSLWAPALAHGLLDSLGVALLYFGQL